MATLLRPAKLISTQHNAAPKGVSKGKYDHQAQVRHWPRTEKVQVMMTGSTGNETESEQ